MCSSRKSCTLKSNEMACVVWSYKEMGGGRGREELPMPAQQIVTMDCSSVWIPAMNVEWMVAS